MKKRFIFILSFAICFLMIMTGCGPAGGSNFTATTLSVFDFYAQHMTQNTEYVATKATSSSGYSASDKAKVGSVISLLGTGLDQELAILASIECFNSPSSGDSGSRVGYYEYDGERIKVEYVNANRSYVVEIGNTDKTTYSFSVSKNDGVYNITSTTAICNARVQFDATSSTLNIELETKVSGETVRIHREIIVQKHGQVISRVVIHKGDTNNRSIYTVECYKYIFDARIKIAKSSSDIGKIDKDLFSDESFAKAVTTDITGYEITIDQTSNAAVTFGDPAQWIIQ